MKMLHRRESGTHAFPIKGTGTSITRAHKWHELCVIWRAVLKLAAIHHSPSHARGPYAFLSAFYLLSDIPLLNQSCKFRQILLENRTAKRQPRSTNT